MRCRPIDLRGRVAQRAGIDDRVPAIDRLGLVSDHRHRRGPRHAVVFEVPHRGPAEVVEDAPGYAGVGARSLERAAEVADGRAVTMKDARDEAIRFL